MKPNKKPIPQNLKPLLVQINENSNFLFIVYQLYLQFVGTSRQIGRQLILSTDRETSRGKKQSNDLAKNNQSYRIYENDILRARLRYTLRNPIQLQADSLQQASILALSYSRESGGLHTPQIPNKQQKAKIYTEGLTTLGRLKIGGIFEFNRQWEDSLANNLNQKDNFTPYYYFTPKAGHYEQQEYKLKALMSYNLVKDQFYIGFGADYQYDWLSGSTDPRIEDKAYIVALMPSLHYHIGNTFMGVFYQKGFGNTDMDIKYKSKTYSLSNLFPERFYYLNMGYGNIAQKYDIIKRNSITNDGVGLQLNTNIRKYQIRADLSYDQENTRFKKQLDTLQMSKLFSKWKQETYRARFLIIRPAPKAIHQLSLAFETRKGKDFNTLYAGRNYFADCYQLKARYYYQTKNDKNAKWQYGVLFNSYGIKKKDILAAHLFESKRMRAGISSRIYSYHPKGNRWSLGLEPGLDFPLYNTLQVPKTQRNVFSTQIAYPDLYYHKTTLLNLTMQYHFITPHLLNNGSIGFFADIVYQHSLFHPEPLPLEIAEMGKNRLKFQVGLKLYL